MFENVKIWLFISNYLKSIQPAFVKQLMQPGRYLLRGRYQHPLKMQRRHILAEFVQIIPSQPTEGYRRRTPVFCVCLVKKQHVYHQSPLQTYNTYVESVDNDKHFDFQASWRYSDSGPRVQRYTRAGCWYPVPAMTMVVRRLWIVGNRCPLSTEDTGQQSTELNISALNKVVRVR